jgi:endonuclease/exonuclease/phosphatase (EEP) superfamily protein YafD
MLSISFLRIDHILVSPEIGVVDAFAGGKEGSEHRPVIADLLLRRDEPR